MIEPLKQELFLRPEILYGLFRPLSLIKGVGPETLKKLTKLGIETPLSLCWHFPNKIQTRFEGKSIAEAPLHQLVTLKIMVGLHMPPQKEGAPYSIMCHDATGVLKLVFFSSNGKYLKNLLPKGEWRMVTGLLDIYHGIRQITHPDHIGPLKDMKDWIGIQPVYPLTTGLGQKVLRNLIHRTLEDFPDLPEWIQENKDWPSFKDALLTIHHPKTEKDLLPESLPRKRLAYDELLAHQLMMGLHKEYHQREAGISLASLEKLAGQLLEKLPFSLTISQEQAFQEIIKDLASPHKMMRLLLGDVGSGKTIVALLAMLVAVESGAQSALLVPTEILASQHFKTISNYLKNMDLRVECLTSSTPTKDRREILDNLKEGKIHIIVGTHALLEDPIVFQNLGLVVIDEQHRFGVAQRLKLINKTSHTNMLAMSATPIPRTLMLTLYGELDISLIAEKPKGRPPIVSRTISLDRMLEVYESLDRIREKGQKVYWVCPLIEESETLDLGHVNERFKELQKRFGNKVGMLHGQMSSQDKDAVMMAFLEGEIDILVATTVIEVGVDVQDATLMVIEHAERFGLAQLHQLRGRVGRGDFPSFCLFLYDKNLSWSARKRLETIRDTGDGFKIAEEDLKIRGSGELFGTRQSGMPHFSLVDLYHHHSLISRAYEDVQDILRRDPDLISSRGQALRLLLHLFGHENAKIYLKAG